MSDIIISFLILACSLAVFHRLLLTRWKAKTAAFWKATDYFWLSLAVLGLAGVAARFGEQESRQELHDLELALQAEYNGQQAWFLTLMNADLHTAFINIEQSPNSHGFTRENVLEPLMSQYHLSNLQLRLASKRPYIDEYGFVKSGN